MKKGGRNIRVKKLEGIITKNPGNIIYWRILKGKIEEKARGILKRVRERKKNGGINVRVS